MPEAEERKRPRPKSILLILAALPPKQIRTFREWLAFPGFNPKPRLLTLFDWLQQHVLSVKSTSIDAEAFARDTGILSSQVDKLSTQLHQMLDQFLAFEQLRKAPHRYLPRIIDAYNELDVDPGIIEKKYRQILKKLKQAPQTAEYLSHHTELEYAMIVTRVRHRRSGQESQFQALHQHTDMAYAVTKMKYLCASIVEAKFLNHPRPTDEIARLQPLLNTLHADFSPFAETYFRVYQLLATDAAAPEVFRETLAFLHRHQALFTTPDAYDLHNYVLNACYHHIDLGRKAFEEIAGTTYLNMLESGLLTPDGHMHPRIYKNIVTLNCRLERYDWSLDFIQENAGYLSGPDREMLPLYCRGLVHFYSGDHRKSIGIFREVMQLDHKDEFWGFESRNLLLKSFFHDYDRLSIPEVEEMHKLVDSFRMYVQRNARLSTFHQKSYQNFIRYFNILLKLKAAPSVTNSRLQTLTSEIEQLQFITHKNWLRAALAEKNWPHITSK